MSEHKIDDIFKKGLQDQKHEVPPEHWEGAREMLGLVKKRRRIAPFWWFGGIAASLFILLATLKVTGVIFDEEGIQLAGEAVTHVDTEVLASEEVINEALASNEVQEEVAQNNNESISSSQENETGGSQEEIIVAQGKIDYKAATEKNNVEKRARNQAFIDEVPNEIDNRSVKNRNNLLDNTGYQKAAIATNSSVKDIIIQSSDNRDLLEGFEERLVAVGKDEKIISAGSEQVKSSIKLEEFMPIGFLEISPLYVSAPVVKISPDFVDYRRSASEDKTKLSFNVGAYAGLITNDIIPSLGLYGEMKWSNHFYTNIGLGFNYESRVRTFQEGVITAGNNRGQNAAAEEYIETDLYKLELPFHIGYQMGRHHLFTGLLLDYPIYTVSSIDSELTFDTQDMLLDPASPPDMMGNMSPSVVTVEKVVNAADLQKINAQLRLGYGVAINRKFRVEVIGGYRFNTRSIVANSIAASPNFMPLEMFENLPSSKFTGGLFLRYQFGK